eukprot:1892903-Prymnesium_polylepis.1
MVHAPRRDDRPLTARVHELRDGSHHTRHAVGERDLCTRRAAVCSAVGEHAPIRSAGGKSDRALVEPRDRLGRLPGLPKVVAP